MRFSATLIAVRDMERSLAFYKSLFDQEVVCDLGWNKTLSCGLALQLNFDRLAEFPAEVMHFKPYTMELYFETEDMDDFMKRLNAHPEVERLDSLRDYPWHQRGIRIFDPDGHMIEVSESMRSVAFREFDRGLSVEEAAEAIQHPLPVVEGWHMEYVKTRG